MPTLDNLSLKLSQNGDDVTVEVKYRVKFSDFEVKLGECGLRYQEGIFLIGVDGNGATNRTLVTFRVQAVKPEPGELQKTRKMVFQRKDLQDDIPGDAEPNIDDEIGCKVELAPIEVRLGLAPIEVTRAAVVTRKEDAVILPG